MRFPQTNVSLISKQFLLRWRWFHCYHYADTDSCLKNGGLFLKYSNLTPTSHINLISYYSRMMFIKIVVRFFIIWHINGEKYEQVSTNWYVLTKWYIYLNWNYKRLFSSPIMLTSSKLFRTIYFFSEFKASYARKIIILWMRKKVIFSWLSRKLTKSNNYFIELEMCALQFFIRICD